MSKSDVSNQDLSVIKSEKESETEDEDSKEIPNPSESSDLKDS